jgi:ribosomal protein L40E
MSEKFLRLIWTCPSCGARNPGNQRTCAQCGAPQPPDVEMELPAQAEVVTEASEIAAARRGADIHCAYCGARNPAGSSTCTQCGADLREGTARRAGRELTPLAPSAHPCPACGHENPETARFCEQCGSPLSKQEPSPSPSSPAPAAARTKRKVIAWKWLLLGLLVMMACAGIFALLAIPVQQVEGTVSRVHWQTVVAVEQLKPVRHEEVAGNPPQNAYDVSCYDKTEQVCHEKIIDLGNGYAKVVQECEDQHQQYCSYTVDEWVIAQKYRLEGDDLSPRYAQPSLSSQQRLGTTEILLRVYFNVPGGEKVYTAAEHEFSQFQIGSRWRLQLNALGGVIAVEPLP